MNALEQYIVDHTERGSCWCGQCKGEPRPIPDARTHEVDVHFFRVSTPKGGSWPMKSELVALLKEFAPDIHRLAAGNSYIEIGGWLGSQELSLRLIGLGEIVGLWRVITPERCLGAFDVDRERMARLAGSGFVYSGPIDYAHLRSAS